MIGDLVVEPQKDGVKLRHDAVLVVARIADQRPATRPAGHLGGLRVVGVSRQGLAQQHADPVRAVHVGLVVRPAPIEVVQVETGGTEVSELPDLIPVKKFTQAGRGVEGEIMINELTQICVGGRYGPVFLGMGPAPGAGLRSCLDVISSASSRRSAGSNSAGSSSGSSVVKRPAVSLSSEYCSFRSHHVPWYIPVPAGLFPGRRTGLGRRKAGTARRGLTGVPRGRRAGR